MTENDDGFFIEHRLHERLHKSNGPARIWDDGGWEWALHGRWHRYYGPVQNLCNETWYIRGNKIK